VGKNNEVGGWTAFVGGSLFEVGSFFMVLEALNRKHVVCFGDAVQGILSQCTHHFHNRSRDANHNGEPTSEVDAEKREQQWLWFGARWHEIGFVGSSIQLVAATVFWVSTITGIPGVINNSVGLVDGIYWVPQIVGGSGFIIARCGSS
jgi:hypothetical protein